MIKMHHHAKSEASPWCIPNIMPENLSDGQMDRQPDWKHKASWAQKQSIKIFHQPFIGVLLICSTASIESEVNQWPLLLTWINFTPSMDK